MVNPDVSPQDVRRILRAPREQRRNGTVEGQTHQTVRRARPNQAVERHTG